MTIEELKARLDAMRERLNGKSILDRASFFMSTSGGFVVMVSRGPVQIFDERGDDLLALLDAADEAVAAADPAMLAKTLGVAA